jgi:hypothetical protein
VRARRAIAPSIATAPASAKPGARWGPFGPTAHPTPLSAVEELPASAVVLVAAASPWGSVNVQCDTAVLQVAP